MPPEWKDYIQINSYYDAESGTTIKFDHSKLDIPGLSGRRIEDNIWTGQLGSESGVINGQKFSPLKPINLDGSEQRVITVDGDGSAPIGDLWDALDRELIVPTINPDSLPKDPDLTPISGTIELHRKPLPTGFTNNLDYLDENYGIGLKESVRFRRYDLNAIGKHYWKIEGENITTADFSNLSTLSGEIDFGDLLELKVFDTEQIDDVKSFSLKFYNDPLHTTPVGDSYKGYIYPSECGVECIDKYMPERAAKNQSSITLDQSKDEISEGESVTWTVTYDSPLPVTDLYFTLAEYRGSDTLEGTENLPDKVFYGPNNTEFEPSDLLPNDLGIPFKFSESGSFSVTAEWYSDDVDERDVQHFLPRVSRKLNMIQRIKYAETKLVINDSMPPAIEEESLNIIKASTNGRFITIKFDEILSSEIINKTRFVLSIDGISSKNEKIRHINNSYLNSKIEIYPNKTLDSATTYTLSYDNEGNKGVVQSKEGVSTLTSFDDLTLRYDKSTEEWEVFSVEDIPSLARTGGNVSDVSSEAENSTDVSDINSDLGDSSVTGDRNAIKLTRSDLYTTSSKNDYVIDLQFKERMNEEYLPGKRDFKIFASGKKLKIRDFYFDEWEGDQVFSFDVRSKKDLMSLPMFLSYRSSKKKPMRGVNGGFLDSFDEYSITTEFSGISTDSIDLVTGTNGNDIIKGSNSTETFKLSKGKDKVKRFDFMSGDTIEIPSEWGGYSIFPKGKNLVIEHDHGETIFLKVNYDDFNDFRDSNSDVIVF